MIQAQADFGFIQANLRIQGLQLLQPQFEG